VDPVLFRRFASIYRADRLVHHACIEIHQFSDERIALDGSMARCWRI
jgi:hypothetical protein